MSLPFSSSIFLLTSSYSSSALNKNNLFSFPFQQIVIVQWWIEWFLGYADSKK